MERSETQIYRGRLMGFSGHWLEVIVRESLHVCCLGIIGVLCRQGISVLFDIKLNVTPLPLFPAFVANILGCFLLGFFMAAQMHIIKLTAPSVYLGMASGYCGSLTTFSSFIFTTVEDISNGFVVRGILGIYTGMTTAVMSFIWGRGMFETIDRCVFYFKKKQNQNNDTDIKRINVIENVNENDVSIKKCENVYKNVVKIRQETETTDTQDMWANAVSLLSKLFFSEDELLYLEEIDKEKHHNISINSNLFPQTCHHGILLICMLLCLICMYTLLTVAVLIDENEYRKATFWWPAIYGPPGVLLRFHLSKLNVLPKFNGRFPIGTFVANTLSTLITASLAGTKLLLHRRHGEQRYAYMIDAIMSGFCGSLSTMSTLAVELFALRLQYKWLYGVTTIMTSATFVVITYGIIRWTV